MTHRFYTGDVTDKSGLLRLEHRLWLSDDRLIHQILRVLRMRSADELILFDGQGTERLYRISGVEPKAVLLELVTDIELKHPSKKVYLAWSLLKKDKNDWVLQKATELGVSHFLPIISERTTKTGFDVDRAQKIIIEASEQCGRHSIPVINNPQTISDVIGEHGSHLELIVTDMDGEAKVPKSDNCLVFVGPEGGWSETEREIFAQHKATKVSISNLTLRAETAAIAVLSQLFSS